MNRSRGGGRFSRRSLLLAMVAAVSLSLPAHGLGIDGNVVGSWRGSVQILRQHGAHDAGNTLALPATFHVDKDLFVEGDLGANCQLTGSVGSQPNVHSRSRLRADFVLSGCRFAYINRHYRGTLIVGREGVELKLGSGDDEYQLTVSGTLTASAAAPSPVDAPAVRAKGSR